MFLDYPAGTDSPSAHLSVWFRLRVGNESLGSANSLSVQGVLSSDRGTEVGSLSYAIREDNNHYSESEHIDQ